MKKRYTVGAGALLTLVMYTVTLPLMGQVFSTPQTIRKGPDTRASLCPDWYGIGDLWWLKEEADPITQWKKIMPKIKQWRFNTVRLGFYFQNAPEDGAPSREIGHPLDLDKLDQLLDYLDSNGIKSILDCHIRLYGYVGSKEWKQDWVSLVSRFKNDPRILAWEIINEPAEITWHESITNNTGVLHALVEVTDSIRKTGDTHPIVYPRAKFWGGRRSGELPEEYQRENIVLSYHYWDQQETLEEALAKAQSRREEWQYWMSKGFPVWLGEFGIHSETNNYNTTWKDEKETFLFLVKACIEDGIPFNIWNYDMRSAAYDELLTTANF